MNLAFLGMAAALGLSAAGSAFGAGFAGMSSVGAWKKCYANGKPAPFIMIAFSGAPLTQTIYGFLLMNFIRGAGVDAGTVDSAPLEAVQSHGMSSIDEIAEAFGPDAEEAETAEAEAPAEQPAEAPQEAPEEPDIPMPEGWEDAQWQALPPEARQAVDAREKAHMRKANGIVYTSCVALENTPVCLTSVSCYARAVYVKED